MAKTFLLFLIQVIWAFGFDLNDYKTQKFVFYILQFIILILYCNIFYIVFRFLKNKFLDNFFENENFKNLKPIFYIFIFWIFFIWLYFLLFQKDVVKVEKEMISGLFEEVLKK